MFSFQLISVLLISVTFYIYLANIIISCDLDFNTLCPINAVDRHQARLVPGWAGKQSRHQPSRLTQPSNLSRMK